MTAYAEVADLKNQVGKTSDKDDTALEFLLDAATEAINRACNRPDGFVSLSTATARIYPGSGRVFQWIDECTSVSLVEVKLSVTDASYTAWASGDWLACSGDPKYPNYNRTPYELLLINPTGDQTHFVSGKFTSLRGFAPEANERGQGAPTVRVTAKWGYATTCPAPIKAATIAQAARWHKRAESVWADSIASNNFEMMLYQKDIDPDISFMLVRGRFIRPSIGSRGM